MKFLLILFFPVFLLAYSDESYLQSFAESFQKGNFIKSLEILDEWEIFQPSHSNRILGMKAAVLLANGKTKESKSLMDECISNLDSDEISNPLFLEIIRVYYCSLEEFPNDLLVPISFFQLCKHEQPKGLKWKYWLGVGQIVVGILAVPISAGTSSTLIISGTAMVVDAATDALNNKECWEKDLNQRQRIKPEDFPPTNEYEKFPPYSSPSPF